MKKTENRMKRTENKTDLRLRLCAVLLLLAVLVFQLGMYLIPSVYATADLTKNDNYTLTSSSREFLRGIDRRVTICLLDPDGSDARLERFLERMTDYNRNITLKTVTVAENAEFAEKYGLSGVTIQPYSVILEGEDRYGFLNYTDLFSFTNAKLGLSALTASEYSYYYSLFSSNSQYSEYLSELLTGTVQNFEGETMLCAGIEYVTAEYLPTNYYLTGHGEKDPSGTILSGIFELRSLECKALSLSDADAVPKDAASILILAPTEDLSAQDVAKLFAYLDDGGQLTVVTNEENLSMPNLMSVLSAYGMEGVSGKLSVMVQPDGEESGEKADESGEKSPENTEGEETGNEENGDAEKAPVKSDTVLAYPDVNHGLTEALASEDDYSVLAEGANAIRLTPSLSAKESSLLLNAILTTEKECFAEGREDERGSFIIGAAAETADGARVVWLTGADSYLKADQEESSVKNAYLLYLATLWTGKTYTSTLKEAPAKPYGTEALSITSSMKMLMGFFMIFLIPAGAATVGAVVRYRRKKA